VNSQLYSEYFTVLFSRTKWMVGLVVVVVGSCRKKERSYLRQTHFRAPLTFKLVHKKWEKLYSCLDYTYYSVAILCDFEYLTEHDVHLLLIQMYY
jgi:hypothetical protein